MIESILWKVLQRGLSKINTESQIKMKILNKVLTNIISIVFKLCPRKRLNNENNKRLGNLICCIQKFRKWKCLKIYNKTWKNFTRIKNGKALLSFLLFGINNNDFVDRWNFLLFFQSWESCVFILTNKMCQQIRYYYYYYYSDTYISG